MRAGLVLVTICTQAYQVLGITRGHTDLDREGPLLGDAAGARAGRAALGGEAAFLGRGDPGSEGFDVPPTPVAGIDPGASASAAPDVAPVPSTLRLSSSFDDAAVLINDTKPLAVSIMTLWNTTAYQTMASLVDEVNKSIKDLVSVGSNETGSDEEEAAGKWVVSFGNKLRLSILIVFQARSDVVSYKASTIAESSMARLNALAEELSTAFETANSKVDSLADEAKSFIQAAVALHSKRRVVGSDDHDDEEHAEEDGVWGWFGHLFGGDSDAFSAAQSAILAANKTANELGALVEQLNVSAGDILNNQVYLEMQGCIAELNTSVLIALASKEAGVLPSSVALEVNSTFDRVRDYATPAKAGIDDALESISALALETKAKVKEMFGLAKEMQDQVETLRDHAKTAKAAGSGGGGGGGGGCGEDGGYC